MTYQPRNNNTIKTLGIMSTCESRGFMSMLILPVMHALAFICLQKKNYTKWPPTVCGDMQWKDWSNENCTYSGYKPYFASVGLEIHVMKYIKKRKIRTFLVITVSWKKCQR